MKRPGKGRIWGSYRSALAAKGAIDEGSADARQGESKPESPKRCRCNDRTGPNELQANHGRGGIHGWGRGDKELTAVRLLEGDDAVAVAVEEGRVLVQRRRAGAALRVDERRRPAHFTEPGTHEFSEQRIAEKAEMVRCPGGGRATTNRIERRTEAAKALPPTQRGTPVVAEPCPSPFSGDSPSTGPCRAS